MFYQQIRRERRRDGGRGTGDAKNFFEKVRLNMGLRVKREVRADKVTKELSDFECPRALSKNFEKEGYI